MNNEQQLKIVLKRWRNCFISLGEKIAKRLSELQNKIADKKEEAMLIELFALSSCGFWMIENRGLA